ncbi:helix-turn-helix domain-containing protein [Cetobacterium somerae]|uniref:helix-turn-helix transcriptional regulator n=1 Tax=Cetobacterium somerae TaxID=188913 RepID=UPI001F055B3C|nr:helix-turn-helix domain-containing protein [Cetobacterium somerae]UPO97472.1 helix-turn-helix domain-containing protein [Cetobacterium somerae]
MLKKERGNVVFNKKLWFFLIFSSIIIFLFGVNEYRGYKKEEELRVERLLNKINLKIELFMSSIGDLENTEPIKEYYNSKEISYYNLIKVLQEIQKKNNIYGKSGYTLSLGKENSDIIITGDGTRNKFTYLKSIGAKEKNQESSNLILIPQEKEISFILKNKIFNLEEGIFWIVNLDRELFFSDLFGNEMGKWEILKDNKIYYLDKNIVAKRKGNNGYVLRSSGLNFKFLYTPNNATFYQMLFLKSFVIFVGLALLAMLIDYSIRLYRERKDLIGEINSLAVVDRRKNLRDFVLGIRKIGEIGELTRKVKALQGRKLKIVLVEIFDSDDEGLDFKNFTLAREYLKDSLSTESVYEHIDIDYKSIAFIIPEESDSVIEDAFHFILENIGQKYNVELIAAVSHEFVSLESFPQEYITCKKILDAKFMAKGRKVLFSENIKSGKLILTYPIETEAKLVSKLLNGNLQGAKKIVDEIFVDRINPEAMDKKDIKEFTGLLYNTLNRVVVQLKEFESSLECENINIESITKTGNLDKIRVIFNELISEICKQKKSSEQDESEVIREKIKSYIDNNYHLDFSLDNLADYLGLSFKYTSILFKKVMGDNFKNYINVYRIEKAKEILKDKKDIKIKDLAEELGYNSSNTFIRIFKKYEGISPTQFNPEEILEK